MTALKPYPDYVDSGVEWLARVPAHWATEPIGKLFTERRTTVSDADFQPLSVTRAGIVPQLENVAKTDNGEGRKLVRSGDFAINSRSDRKGSSGVSDRDGSVSVITTVVTPRGMDTAYIHHLLRSEPFQEEFYRYGSGIVADLWSTRWSAMKGIRLAVPPLIEQRRIAAFLNRETAEIDAFIADQEGLIGLLAERRAATISHAVTKGLDSSVPMKDSGVEWMGEMPEHWKLLPLKRALRRISQGVSPQADGGLADENSTGVLRAGCVNGGVFNQLEHKRLPEGFEYDDAIRVRIGDLIVNRASGSPTLVGSAARVRILDFDLILCDKTFRLEPERDIDLDFLELFMNSTPYRKQVLGAISGAEGLANNLPMSALRSFLLALPEVGEQREIAEFARTAVEELDAAMTDARVSIALSRERRAALISAAVTGKIDVREHGAVA